MDAHPFALLGDATIERVVSRLQSAMADWSADWGLDSAVMKISCARAWERGASVRRASWRGCRGVAGSLVWFAWDEQLRDRLQGQIFPLDQTGTVRNDGAGLAADGASDALAALCAALASQLGSTRPASMTFPPTALFAEGSGALCVTLTNGSELLSMLIEHGCIAPLAPVSEATAVLNPVPLRALAGQVPVRMAVSAGRAQLSIGDLMTLAVGDVLRLDRTLDQPFTVSGQDGGYVISGYPARRGAGIVIEVVSECGNTGQDASH